jgi:hypothetical protein
MSKKAWVRAAGADFWQRLIVRKWSAVGGLALFIAAAVALAAGVGAFAPSRIPESLQIVGYAGHLGEWELTAALSKHDARAASGLAGPLKMKHVGFCSKDGPEEKSGAMQVRLSRLSSSVEVKLLIDGVECSHSGDLSNAYMGSMVCPDRKPVPLTLWIR